MEKLSFLSYVLQMLQHEQLKNLLTKPAALAEELDRSGQQGLVLAETRNSKYTSSSRTTPVESLQTAEAKSYSSDNLLALKCTCHKRPQVTAWGSRYGVLGTVIFSETRHQRDCPWVSLQNRSQYSLRYILPRYLLNKAVELGFNSSSGAGGISLAPNLRVISVMTNQNPAMALLWLRRSDLKDIIVELRKLFVEGRASPFDVDEYGCNLIHVSYNTHRLKTS